MEKMTGKASDLVLYLMNADKDKYFDLTEHKETRSKKANAYFHRLVGLLAKGEKNSFFKKKNELILHYGVQEFERDSNGDLIIAYLPDNEDYKKHEIYHYYPTSYGGEVRGVIVRAFLLLIGTHKYLSNEMAHLIECTRDECIGAGIPIEEVETIEEHKLMEELQKKCTNEQRQRQSHQK